MARQRPYEAVIFDMDGVLTRTATLHEEAWKRTFDELLQSYSGQRPFSSADYRAHVDGKPRYQGAQDFLRSRAIELPFGEHTDEPGEGTVCAIGNRKNETFLSLLERGRGVEVFDDAVAALNRWKRGGMRVAAVSGSRNCRRILRSADLETRFDAIVDGQVAVERELPGKAEIMLEAARRLRVDPEDAVVLEDATAGVRAGRRAGFGQVVGVSRGGNPSDLSEAGAHLVVRDAYRVRFLRRLPSALQRMQELAGRRGDRPLAVFLDFDGTLAPIVDDPREAGISQAMRETLTQLRCPLAVISGRDRDDVESRVGIEGIFYAGNHGFDIAGEGQHRALPEAEEALGDVDAAQTHLERHLGHIAGLVIERKRYSVAVHYRQADDPCVRHHVDQAVEAVRAKTGLRRREGKKVVELEPAVDWDKGRALQWLVDILPEAGTQKPFVLYIGDDETDEDAFAVLATTGAGVRVADELTSSLADYQVRGPDEVRTVLERLAELDACGS